MKIINLLNKISNGTLEDGACLGNFYIVKGILNNEVEVIEENKEIEELNDNDIYDYNHLQLKINELVRAVNKLNKEREEK